MAAPAPAEPEPIRNMITNRDASWAGVGGGLSTPEVNGLTYPPLWQGIRQISGDAATLNCNLEWKDEDGDWIVLDSHQLHKLSTQESNNIQTASVYKETLWHHMLWLGDGRGYIERDGNGVPISEIPLLPDRTWTILIKDELTRTTEKFHITNVYRNWHNRNQGRQQFINPFDEDTYVVIPDRDVLHFQGMSYDGISGYNPSRLFRRTLNIGTGLDGKMEVSLRRSGVPPLVLIAPPGAFKSEPDAVEFLRNWNEYHAGIMNTGKTGLLREGIQPHQLTPSNVDDQAAEMKKLTRQDVASILNMPVQMLGDTDAATFNNMEQMWKQYQVKTFKPPARRWELERDKKLLTTNMKNSGRYRYRFDYSPLEFVDADSKARFFDSGRKNNALSGDDIREMMGLKRLNLPETTNYANPNTSAGGMQLPDTTEDDEEQARNLVRVRCQELAKVEVSRIEEAKNCKQLETFLRRVDKQLGMHANALTNAVENFGGDTTQIAGYLSSRKAMITDRVVAAQSHDITLDEPNDVAEHIYHTLFEGNGHAV